MKKLLILALGMALPLSALAQATVSATPIPTICTDKEPDCKDKLLLENLDLKIGRIVEEFNAAAKAQYDQAVRPQMQPLQDERAKLIARLNAAHPGYVWHDPTSPGDVQGFRPAPVAPAAPTAPAKKPLTAPAPPH